METTNRTPVLTRSSCELAVLVSLVSLSFSLALSWFLNVPETPLVIGTIIAATAAGWHRVVARPRPVVRHLQLVA